MPDWTAPIIVVGAGRSGSTRLVGTLGAHRDVYMMSETSFLLPRLWATFHERPEYVRGVRLSKLAQQALPEWRDQPWWVFWRQHLHGRLENLGPLLATLEQSEDTRLQRLFGAFFAETLIPPPMRRPRWGFKEIWAGSAAFPHEWALYHGAFPAARWIHSVRHPLGYLRSMFSNLGRTEPTAEEIVYELTQWVAMVRHARELRRTGRFVEYRMEDFDDELPRILAALDLPADPACAEAAALSYVPSRPQALSVAATLIDRVDGLRAIADDLHYELP